MKNVWAIIEGLAIALLVGAFVWFLMILLMLIGRMFIS